jgi:hypothetical protein
MAFFLHIRAFASIFQNRNRGRTLLSFLHAIGMGVPDIASVFNERIPTAQRGAVRIRW